MKSLSAVLIFGLVVSGLCFAQTQSGNVSYNASKKGLTISHASMSFGTRVRVTNLRNNQEVIAIVDGRIPVSDPRIADISAEAGDAIGMSSRGYTEVRLEQIIPVQAPEERTAVVLEETGETIRNPPPPASEDNGTRPPQRSSAPPVPASDPDPGKPASRPETVPPAPVPPYQPPYMVTAGQNCLSPSLGLIILILLILVVLLLAAIFVLLLSLHRISLRWFWHYSLWVRRHYRRLRRDRYGY
jgi:hypothetical protein